MAYFLFLSAFFFSILSWATPFKVVLDPGHGGVDSGASRYGYREADIALKVGLELRKLFLKDKRFETLMTRKSNRRLSLKDRAQIANNYQGDLFISIHANASTDRRARGAEFYFQNQLPPSEEMAFLAARENEVDQEPNIKQTVFQKVHAEIENKDVIAIVDDLLRNQRIKQSDQLSRRLLGAWQHRTRKRKYAIKQAPFFLTSNVNMPSALVELGYLTNKREAKLLATPAVQKKMAKDIYEGIVRYKEMLDK